MNSTNACQAVSHSPWANAAVIATAVGALVFVVLYAWTTRGAWRRTVFGAHVMTFMVVILAVSSLAVASIFFGTNWPNRDLIRGLAWSAVAGCVWWRIYLLYRVQHEVPPDEADRGTPATTT